MALLGAKTNALCNGFSKPLHRADPSSRYFTDSLTNRIYAYDYDDGKISNRRIFIDFLSHGYPSGTFPDGLCMDSQGGLWSARYSLLCSSVIHVDDQMPAGMDLVWCESTGKESLTLRFPSRQLTE